MERREGGGGDGDIFNYLGLRGGGWREGRGDGDIFNYLEV